MGRYLGTVRIIRIYNSAYVNFIPFYVLNYGSFEKLTYEDKCDLFPDSAYQNINLYSASSDRNDFADQFSENTLYIVDLKSDLYEDNPDGSGGFNRTRYKYNLDNLKSNQYGTIDVFGYYYYLSANEITGDFSKSYLNVSNQYMQKGFRVVSELNTNNNVLVGPFTVGQRPADGEKVITTHEHDKRGNDRFYVKAYVKNNDSREVQVLSIDDNRYQVFNSNDHKITYVDVISDNNLLAELKESLDKSILHDGMLDIKDTSKIADQYNKSNLMNLPEPIRKRRVERLTEILRNEDSFNTDTDNLCKLIVDMLVVKKNSPILEPVFNELANNKEFMNSVPQIQVLSSKIKELETTLEDKQQALVTIDKELEEKNDAEFEAKLNSEYEELREKINAAKEELNLVEENLDKAKGTLSTHEFIKKLEEDTIYLERRNEEQRKQSEAIEKKIDSIFDEKTEKALDLTFDGMISQKMIQAAAEWETAQQNKQYDEIISTLAKSTCVTMPDKELIDYLCGVVNSYRPNYDKNTIINIFICIAQGFLTVFSGAPGAGKTSACNIVAHALGLLKPSTYVDPSYSINPNRYIDVSVERGWTSKRDFIGYFNPLTKKFDRNNSRLFDALNILDIEARNKETNRPFIVLLDEANLSPMEYYWADFMNICDDRCKDSTIDLGEDYRFVIPDELRFVATINNDHTTESLSPRLIDRAWVIRLPNARPGVGKTTVFSDNDNQEILWSDFTRVFRETTEELSGAAKEVYEAFISKAKKIHVRVSPRSDSAIRQYWGVASRIMEKDESVMVDSSIIALDYAIMQKVLPQISGSGDAMREGLEELKTFASDKNLNMTASTIEEIIAKGDDSMNFYQYFG